MIYLGQSRFLTRTGNQRATLNPEQVIPVCGFLSSSGQCAAETHTEINADTELVSAREKADALTLVHTCFRSRRVYPCSAARFRQYRARL